MKAIILTDHFGNGGAERVASVLINGLSGLPGIETHVCVFEDENNYHMDASRVSLHLLTTTNGSYGVRIFNRINNFVKVIRQVRPDVIYSFGPIMAIYVYLAVKLSGVKGITVIDSERNDPRKEPVSDFKKKIRDFCYTRADIIVCQTEMAVELLKSRGIDTRFEIISNPISPNLPTWKGKDSKDIITACRLTEQKNLPMLIEAFGKIHKKHPDYRLVIYGEGELRNDLENLVKKTGLENAISLPGFAKEIHKTMTEAYMYVSSSDYEGISNSMLESLGIGLPIVCTDCPVGGAAMFIENGVNGLLTPVGDADKLADAICTLIENPDMAVSFSEKSRSINETLSVDKITKKWLSLTQPVA